MAIRAEIMIALGGVSVDSKRVWEVALTVVVALALLAAAEGRYPYGFYMALRTAATVGGVYWAVRVYQAGHGAGYGPSWLLRSCSIQSCQCGCTGRTGSQSTSF